MGRMGDWPGGGGKGIVHSILQPAGILPERDRIPAAAGTTSLAHSAVFDRHKTVWPVIGVISVLKVIESAFHPGPN